MTREDFIKYVRNPELLNETTLAKIKAVVNDYPSFSLARMMYLRNLRNIGSYRFEEELSKNAIFISDRKVLYTYLTKSYTSSEELDLIPFDKAAFNHFFDKNAEVNVSDLEISKEAPFEFIGEEEIKTDNVEDTIDLIDRFIIENPTIKNEMKVETEKTTTTIVESDEVGDELITDTLAVIYMSQGLYQEALEAYEKLSLKFPEKNSYFATQIGKIKELISKEL